MFKTVIRMQLHFLVLMMLLWQWNQLPISNLHELTTHVPLWNWHQRLPGRTEINLRTAIIVRCGRWSALMWTTFAKIWRVPVWLFILNVFQLPFAALLIAPDTHRHSHSLTWWSHKPCCKCLPSLADCSQQKQPVLNSPQSLPWVPSRVSTPPHDLPLCCH